MIWQHKITRFSKEIEEGVVPSAEVQANSYISVKYVKERKVLFHT